MLLQSGIVHLGRLLHVPRYGLLDHKYVEALEKSLTQGKEKTFKVKAKLLWREMKFTLAQGFKDLWSDSKWLYKLSKTKKQDDYTGFELCKQNRIIIDLLKFIPYSFILVVPFAQLCLPLLLWLYPNAIPSFFLFDTAENKRIATIESLQEEAYHVLIEKLMGVLRQGFYMEEQFTHYDLFKRDFFAVIDDLGTRLHYNRLSSEELILILNFLGGDYVTGTSILNKVVNLFTLQIPRLLIKTSRWVYSKAAKKQLEPYQDPWFIKGDFRILQLNYFPFEMVKRRLLIYQIQRKFRQINRQDTAIEKYGMKDICDDSITTFARQRGLPTLTCYETLRNVIQNDWVKIVTHPRFDDNERLWYAVMMHHFMRQTDKHLD